MNPDPIRRVAAEYSINVATGVDTPVHPGKYRIQVVEGGTYRNLASRREYTIVSIDANAKQITYRYSHRGDTVSRTGPLGSLAVVESVGDTPGGILTEPRFYTDDTDIGTKKKDATHDD